MSADPYSLLLENLASGSPGGANMHELLAQMGETDPRIGMLAKYMAQRQAAAAAGEDDEEDASAPDNADAPAPGERGGGEAAALSRERVEAIRSLQRVARSMFAELEVLRQRNDELAAALGACYLCWGEDIECEVCDGRGAPGSSRPDMSLFFALVAPALRRLRDQRGVARGDAAPPRPGPPGRTINSNEKPN